MNPALVSLARVAFMHHDDKAVCGALRVNTRMWPYPGVIDLYLTRGSCVVLTAQYGAAALTAGNTGLVSYRAVTHCTLGAAISSHLWMLLRPHALIIYSI